MQSGFLALNVWPPARDYVAQMKYKPPPRFNAGFLVPDGKGRRTLIGRLLPQPPVHTADGRQVLLDEVLGNRFALLLRTAHPAEDFARLRQPIWGALGAARVALLPVGAPTQTVEGVEVAAEIDDALSTALADYAGHALLLRPDHYVAAAIPLDAMEGVSRAVEALLAATWTRADAPASSDEGQRAA